MNPVTRAPIVIAVFWAACAHGAPPLEPPSDAALLDLTYSGVAQQPVELRDGRWQGEPFVPGGASRQRVELVRDFRRDGDLDGDGRSETVVVLAESSGGSGVVSYLAVVGFRDGAWRNVGTALLGDRVQLRDARIAERKVELDLVQAGPGDAMALETRYLAALQTVTGYGFLSGRLALRGQKDGQPQLLLFERQPAEAL